MRVRVNVPRTVGVTRLHYISRVMFARVHMCCKNVAHVIVCVVFCKNTDIKY